MSRRRAFSSGAPCSSGWWLAVAATLACSVFPEQALLPLDDGTADAGEAGHGEPQGGSAGEGATSVAGQSFETAGQGGVTAEGGGRDAGGAPAQGGAIASGGTAAGGTAGLAAQGGSLTAAGTAGMSGASAAGGAAGGSPSCSRPESMTLAASQDSWVSALGGGNKGNFGSDARLHVASGSDERHAFIAFELSGVPAGATISSAALQLTLVSALAAEHEVAAHAVSRAWREDKITWEDATPSAAWVTPGGDAARAASDLVTLGPGAMPGDVVEWDVLRDVQADLTAQRAGFGWMLREQAGTEEAASFAAREAAQVPERPTLKLVFCRSSQAL